MPVDLPKDLPSVLDELHEEERKSSKLLKKIHKQNPTCFPRQGSQVKRGDGMGQGVKMEEYVLEVRRIPVGAVPDASGPSVECGLLKLHGGTGA